jgi:hypothetical protein
MGESAWEKEFGFKDVGAVGARLELQLTKE